MTHFWLRRLCPSNDMKIKLRQQRGHIVNISFYHSTSMASRALLIKKKFISKMCPAERHLSYLSSALKWDSHASFWVIVVLDRKLLPFLSRTLVMEAIALKTRKRLTKSMHLSIKKNQDCDSRMPCILTALHWLLYGIVKKRISSISLTYSKKRFNNLHAIFSHSHLHCGMKAFIEYKSMRLCHLRRVEITAYQT